MRTLLFTPSFHNWYAWRRFLLRRLGATIGQDVRIRPTARIEMPWNLYIGDHTIIGDRGRGDSPNSSDGVVPYWSSHMDGAKSEDIVPSDHNAHQNPQAIQDVSRILKRHAN